MPSISYLKNKHGKTSRLAGKKQNDVAREYSSHMLGLLKREFIVVDQANQKNIERHKNNAALMKGKYDDLLTTVQKNLQSVKGDYSSMQTQLKTSSASNAELTEKLKKVTSAQKQKERDYEILQEKYNKISSEATTTTATASNAKKKKNEK